MTSQHDDQFEIAIELDGKLIRSTIHRSRRSWPSYALKY